MKETDPVIFELDLHRPAALTPEQRAELETLAATPDSEIDYSDIPPLTEAFFANAQRNPFYRPIKAQVTVRLDADVLAWLKTGGRGYQTKLNAILRRAMLQDAPPK
ncbi:BrnA antitoxin family protein [Methylobacterium sp. Leaf112]|uniref:BrnA antitoxin family protein n=1 Tax=Methylobacterium sp. Leaf112 TaxID=1736258 RepID=UPI0006FEA2E6|nr:BrnA antitoxin family protein [Methylobacterium sp. Leaf112]KQP72173.1 cytoplasmic protein [Methylobacterium sp. Leaf112]